MPDRISGMLRTGMQPGEAIEYPLITRAIANAQRKVESHNFDIRKQLLEYDDVANDQRLAIYSQRNELLDISDVSETINSIREDVLKVTIDTYITPQSLEEIWDILGLEQCLKDDFDLNLPIALMLDKEPQLHEETLRERIFQGALEAYQRKEQIVGVEIMRNFEKGIMLQTLDSLWKEHLSAMDYLRQGIHLRGYAQKDPRQEYKRESFAMFSSMLESLKYAVISTLSKVQVSIPEEAQMPERQRREAAQCSPEQYSSEQYSSKQFLSEQQNLSPHNNSAVLPDSDKSDKKIRHVMANTERKAGRNDPCPCGSEKKYKYCHGQLMFLTRDASAHKKGSQ